MIHYKHVYNYTEFRAIDMRFFIYLLKEKK